MCVILMKFNWYQLNVVNRNRVLPALGTKKVELLVVQMHYSFCESVSLVASCWCQALFVSSVRHSPYPLSSTPNMSQTPPSALRTTKRQETAADPTSTVDTIVAKVLEALQKQQQPGTSGSSSGSSGK